MWFKKSKKFFEGAQLVSSKISDELFSSSLDRIHVYLKTTDEDSLDISCLTIENNDSLTPDELALVNKSLLYIVQRLSLIIISPTKLQNDLRDIGFSSEKIELLLSFYSKISCEFVKDLKLNSNIAVQWNEQSTTSDDICTVKCKQSRANIKIQAGADQINLEEMDSKELSKLFNSIETIQRELDFLTFK